MTQFLGAAGAERQIAHLAVGLAALDYPVTLLVLGVGPAEDVRALEAAGVDVRQLGAMTPRMRARAMGRIVRAVRRADVVVCSSWDATFWGRVAAIVARRPVLVIEHAVYRAQQFSLSGKPRARWIALHNRLLEPFTYATVACAGAQLPVLRSEGVADDKVVLIPNGVPVANLRAASAGGDRAELGIPPEALVLVHVARLTRLKNQAQTVATADALRAQGLDVHVVLVGDGEDRATLEAQAGERPWLHVLGIRDDVPRMFGLADLALLPSLAEAMPMVLAEAFAAGAPVVGYDVGDVGTIIRQTGAGAVVAQEDGAGFTAACARLLREGDERARLAEQATEAADLFDAATMSRRYAALLEAAADGRRPREAALDEPLTPARPRA